MRSLRNAPLLAAIGRLGILTLLLLPVAPGESVAEPAFDHFTTGFRLEGSHRLADCESCHTDGMFAGSPRHCAGCHSQSSRTNATTQAQTHITTSENCVACHRPDAWAGIIRVDHFETKGSCSSCHNGRNANGKPGNHVPAGNQCEDCHSTFAWR